MNQDTNTFVFICYFQVNGHRYYVPPQEDEAGGL
jgi:hypothetical protein